MKGNKFLRNTPPPDGIHSHIEFTPIKYKEMSKGEEIAIILLALFGGMLCAVAVIMELSK